MTDGEPTTITEHEARQVERANDDRATARRLHPRPVAAAEQLGPLGDGLRGGRLHAADARLARRSRHRRGGQRAPRGVRQARPSARSPTTSTRSSPASTRKPAVIGHSFGGLLTQILAGRGLAAASVAIDAGAVPRRAAAAVLGAEVRQPGARQPGEPQPRGAADLRPVPLRVRQRGRRGRGEGSCTRPTRSRRRARRCSRRRRRTSTRGPRPRSTPRTPSAGRC